MSGGSSTRPWGRGAAEGPRRPAFSGEFVGALFWLIFLGFPISDTVTGHYSQLWQIATLVVAAAFVLLYVAVCLYHRPPWRRPRYAWPAVATLAAIACLLTLRSDSNWSMLFIFTASIAAALIPPPANRLVVVGCVALLVTCLLINHADFGDIIGYGTTTLGIGILLTLMHALEDKNDELAAARGELARLAVTEERERFARDLHDLLGHTLSVIALKAELAGRLLESDADAARKEIDEVRDVARQALGEVRDAVGGYRRPTLDQELEGARAALAAAGVEATVTRDAVSLAPDVESALAWTVREGATNVIRHAQASSCEIRVVATLDGARVEICDDGPGAADGDGAGNGLRGLAERVKSLGGDVEAGPVAGGGFRLAMTVPLR